MAKVQRVPRSLLALLGIVGENPPSRIDDSYRAVIDVSGLVIAELAIEQTSVVDAAAVAGSTVTATVPQGEVWFLETMRGQINAAAAVVNNVITIGRGDNSSDGVFYAVAAVTVPPIIRDDTVQATFNPPSVLVAGQTANARLARTDSGVAQTLVLTVRFRRILV